ncbi:neural-cadherin-like [Pomacea canaliculata]|uniref:neural-cadherin-like n=1 Tax=Pomacea canaliculata TaxID=400727 RepID=UPI000D7311C2|nr:neural-cadherin-like [Pomacea canaliculata]
MEKYIQVTVYAEDGGNPSLQGWCAFRLQVQDINDNAPKFDKTQYISNITIDTRVGTTFLTVRAYDNDTGVNAEVEYSFLDSSNGTFGIVSSNGFIYLDKQLQQGKTQYSLRVMAKDKGVPPLNSTVSVTVNVITSSNKPPSFDKNYTGMVYTVSEMAAQGVPIIQDITCNSNIDDPRVDFQLADANSGTFDTSQFFYIRKSDSSPNKATVYSNGVFDFETKQSHIVRLRCLNYGSVTLSTEINPVVQLLDANNKRPTFVGTDGDGRFQGSVTENLGPGQECLTITGQDLDITANFSKLTFEISAADNGTNNMDFELVRKDDRSAVLKSKRSFDRETKELYLINVIAKDGAPSAVLINDVNDNPPYFEQTLYNLTVPEDFNLNTLIEPYVTAKDPDSSDSNRLSYFIDSGNGQIPTFGVREGNGALFLVRKLDYENNDRFFQLKLRAFDGIHSATTTVNVLVTDVNDNSPVLLPSSLIIRNIVEEDDSVRANPRLLLQFNVTDADVDRPNKFQFSITSTSLLSFFRIDSTTGQLFLTDKLDRDLPNGRDTYIVDVQVTDELTNPLSGFASVSVLPLDINDNDPKFINGSLVGSVNENSEKGSSVMLVQVFDPDYMENGTVVFSILNSYSKNATGNYFAIDANTGYVTTNVAKELLDREKDPELYMVVKLADKGTPPRSSTGTITISLTDINDNPPIFQKKIYKVEMSESLPFGGNVISVTATDADIGVNANLIYDLQSSADRKYFDILTMKNVGNIIVFKAVDYDPPMNEKFFNLTVSVTDGRFTDTCYVEIKVTDFNDNAPQIQPQTLTVNISENVVVDYLLAYFSATDIDEGINSVFQFSIDRQTDLLRQFTVDPSGGVVRVRRPLDRETTPSYSLHILAIDEGDPVQTGTATLNVILGDVNDNYPTFKDNYQPQVPENDPNFRDIQSIFAKDPDLPPFSFPYGFNLAPCNDNDVCQAFGFRVDRAGDNGNGTAVITSKMTYDREKRKYYLIPIIMWDMYATGSSLSQTGTNTLTVTIADKNDNPMKEGHQDIFVFNYKGMFGPIDIGRVYVNDPDDWDLPDKTFTFLEPKWMEAYFKVQSNGTIVMEKGVPSNSDKEKYTFSVEVVDNVRKEKVVATVSVVVNDLSDEAVRSSGAVRLQGISAEDFIKRPPLDASTYGESKYDKFRKLLAAKLGTALENVLIISVQDVEGGVYIDVCYTAHGSAYYQSPQTDSLIVNNLQEFENTAGVSISQVPIDMCAQEIFEGGCYNYLDITGRPAMVNSNGTSFVGVEAFVRAKEGCRAKDFPDLVECFGDYCYNGGTCQKDDFGVLSCLCLSGYDGPRCQQLRHNFDGKSYAMYPTLEQCEDGQTSIEFITTQSDGLLLYNGPKVTPPADQPPDFISLELRGGFPVLMIDHGSGSTTLTVDGKNANGNVIISTLADGKWHRIDIIRTGKHVEMIVDFCESAAEKSVGGTLDDRPCRATGNTPGTYSFLNVGTLLQLYDLYYKEIAGVSSGQNGCPREDTICGATCGVNGVCTASLTPPQATCVCKPGWRGDQCTTATTIRDLGKAPTYLTWTLSSSFLTGLLPCKVEMQAMFRTRSKTGVIFATYGRINSQYIVVQIQNGTLQVIYNLDDIDKTLELSHGNVSNGQWHVVRVMRNLQHVTLISDGGEGRNYNFSRGSPTGNFSVTLRDTATVGAVMSSLQGQTVYDRNLIDTCVQDIRLNNVGFPMTRSENTGQYDTGPDLAGKRQIRQGITSSEHAFCRAALPYFEGIMPLTECNPDSMKTF